MNLKGSKNRILICLLVGLVFGVLNLFMFLFNYKIQEFTVFLFLVLFLNGLLISISDVLSRNNDNISAIIFGFLCVIVPIIYGMMVGVFSNKKWKYFVFIILYLIIQIICAMLIIINSKFG